MECYIPNVSIDNETIMFNLINVFKTNKTLDEVDKEILKKLNNDIMKFSKNKGIIIISKLNYRNLFYGIENAKYNITEKINRANRLYEAQLLATKNGEVTPYRRSVFEERVRQAQKEMRFKESKN